MTEAWPLQPRLLGSRVNRVDAWSKTTGRATFSDDVTRPGMIYGRILRSPHAHARVLSIDLTAAQKAPGVRAVMAVASIGHKVLYAGEEVAALAATTEQQAEDALRLIRVAWDVLPHLATVLLAARAAGKAILDGVYNDVQDAAGFRRECEQAAEMGFDGKTLIHPGQVDIANDVWAPDESDIEYARRVIEAFEAAMADGRGVITVDGRMIENLHVDNARRTIAVADAITGLG